MSEVRSLRGKSALVTGGSRRLGAAICRELAARGAAVVVHYRHSEAEAIALNRALKITDPEAEVIRGYCAAVRGALGDSGQPPLDPGGLQLQHRLSAIATSLDRVAQKGGGPRR